MSVALVTEVSTPKIFNIVATEIFYVALVTEVVDFFTSVVAC